MDNTQPVTLNEDREAWEYSLADLMAIVAEDATPPEYRREWAARSPRHGEIRAAMSEWVGAFTPSAPGLWLWGPTGSGKTHLAWRILNGVMRRGYSSRLYTTTELLDDIIAAMKSESGHEADWIPEQFALADLIALDDVGAEYHKRADDWAAARLVTALEIRCRTGKPLIATSNYHLRDIGKVLGGDSGERIRSRLVRLCPAVWRMPDGDYRLAGAAATAREGRGGERR